MEKSYERRAEQRLSYRWPVRFTRDTGQKTLSAQMFDLSSMGMAILYHANEECPEFGQSVSAHFGVPHFDDHGSFDTAYFNRIGRVCRVDNVTTKVNRIAIQFAEPLFFKPGEQDITKSEAQRRLHDKAKSIAQEKAKKTVSVGVSTQTEEKTRLHAEIQAKVEEKVRAGNEHEPRNGGMAQAETHNQAILKEEDQGKVRDEAEKRAAVETQVPDRERLYEQVINEVKDQAEQEIIRIESEASYRIAGLEAEAREKLQANTKVCEVEEDRPKKDNRENGKGRLMKKIEEFITNRNQIY